MAKLCGGKVHNGPPTFPVHAGIFPHQNEISIPVTFLCINSSGLPFRTICKVFAELLLKYDILYIVYLLEQCTISVYLLIDNINKCLFFYFTVNFINECITYTKIIFGIMTIYQNNAFYLYMMMMMIVHIIIITTLFIIIIYIYIYIYFIFFLVKSIIHTVYRYLVD